MNEIVNVINSKDNYYDKIHNLLKLPVITNNLKIEFALYCAKDCFKYIDATKYPDLQAKTTKCLELVADYLLGKAVSKKDLNVVANAAYAAANAANAADAAAYAADAAAYAANAAAIAAANAAAYAADAAAIAAANAALYAAYTAANVVTKEQKLQELYDHLLNMIIKELKLDKTFKILYVA